ncbi:MAG TPA: LysR family transcriptional regulator [Burkholderiaceae bacterium]
MLPDLSSIKLFLTTARLGSLSKAAEASHMSLSAASRRLTSLEDQLGIALFDRRHSGVVPTPAGEALNRRAKALMVEVEGLLAELADYAGGGVGRVRLHANVSAMSQDLPEKLARWASLNPSIKLELQEARSRNIVDAVRHGLADVGVVTSEPEPDLRFEPYCSDELCVLVPARHAIRARRVAFADLLGEDFVGLDDSAMVTQTMKRAAEAADKFLRLRVQVSSFEAVCKLVAAGQGIGVLPRGAVRALIQPMKLRMLSLSDPWAKRQMYLCCKTGHLPAPASRFLEFMLGG